MNDFVNYVQAEVHDIKSDITVYLDEARYMEEMAEAVADYFTDQEADVESDASEESVMEVHRKKKFGKGKNCKNPKMARE